MKISFWKKFLSGTKKAIADSVIIEVKGRVNAGILNIRKKPDIKSKVLGQLKRGDIVDVFNVIEDWYQIVLSDKTAAYVSKKYVDILRQEKSGRVTVNILNIRKQPNTESQVLGKLHKGDIVSVLREYNDWIKIQHNNAEAYIYKEFVELLDVPVVVKPTETPVGPAAEGNYFYQRKDLADVQLEPKNTIPVQGDYHQKIAAKTWNNYGGLISKISDELKIDVATGLSVLCVESSGNGFSGDKMIIRFENHVLDMFWGKNNKDLFDQHFKYNEKTRRDDHFFRADKKDKWEPCHTSQDMEWKVLEFAKKLDETAALKSISMGAPQVMGFNHKFIGYTIPQDMFKFFNKDIRYHLLALFDFCNYKPERIRYLQKRDFYSFSVEYNGSSAPAGYEKRFKMYYDIFKDILP